MTGLTELTFDPAADRELGLAGLQGLIDGLKQWRKRPPCAVLLTVVDDAWRWDSCGTNESTARAFNAVVSGLFGLDVPLVVSASGAISGPGLALLLVADVRVAGPAATFAAGPPDVAVIGGTDRLLVTRASPGAGMLAFHAGSWSAERAEAAGIVSDIGDPEQARTIARTLARTPEQSAALVRASRSEQRAELASALAYRAWLAEPDDQPA